MAELRPGMIDSGRVIGRGFGALGKNFPSFLGASLALTGVPGFAIQYLLLTQVASGSSVDFLSITYVLTWLTTWLLGALLQGILVRATILHLAGQGADMGQSIVTALRLILPIFAISFLVLLGTAIGLLLLIVPGCVFYIMMMVAVPALIEERKGVFGSMGRSYKLTRGSYLPIFVLIVLYSILAAIVSTIFHLALGVEAFGMGFNDPLMAAAAAGLTGTVTAMVGGVMIASLYIELRSVKEGATTDDLASIFA